MISGKLTVCADMGTRDLFFHSFVVFRINGLRVMVVVSSSRQIHKNIKQKQLVDRAR